MWSLLLCTCILNTFAPCLLHSMLPRVNGVLGLFLFTLVYDLHRNVNFEQTTNKVSILKLCLAVLNY